MTLPKSNLYHGTKVSSIKTMEEVSKLLKKFGIIQKRLTQESPEKSFFEFIIKKDETEMNLMIRINIPFIEKKKGRYGDLEYDEERSFRYFFHYFKALLSAKESEMYTMEQIFMSHIVTQLPSGEEITLGEQMQQQVDRGQLPFNVDGFNIKAKALPDPKSKPRLL
jgi:hypothetical protein